MGCRSGRCRGLHRALSGLCHLGSPHLPLVPAPPRPRSLRASLPAFPGCGSDLCSRFACWGLIAAVSHSGVTHGHWPALNPWCSSQSPRDLYGRGPHGNTALAAGRSEAGKLCGGELVAEELMAGIRRTFGD